MHQMFGKQLMTARAATQLWASPAQTVACILCNYVQYTPVLPHLERSGERGYSLHQLQLQLPTMHTMRGAVKALSLTIGTWPGRVISRVAEAWCV